MKVGIIAPSSPTEFESEKITSLGFDFVYEELPLFLSWRGTPKQRAQIINSYFKDKSIDIIWCLRGGMGSSDVIKYIDFSSITKKPFIGYSDITIIQLALLKHAKLKTIQYYMPGNENFDVDKNLLMDLINGKSIEWKFSKKNIFKKGCCKGKIAGGCLDLIFSSIGTPHEINTDNKILFLEDVDISPERLINLLCHMKYSGKFQKVKGIIFSKIPGCKNYRKYLEYFFQDFKIPVILDLNFGHTKKKMPLVLGGECVVLENKIIMKM